MESADLEWSAEVGRAFLGGGALSTGTQGNRLTVSSARKGRHLDECWRMEVKCKFQNRTLKSSSGYFKISLCSILLIKQWHSTSLHYFHSHSYMSSTPICESLQGREQERFFFCFFVFCFFFLNNCHLLGAYSIIIFYHNIIIILLNYNLLNIIFPTANQWVWNY